MTTVLRRRRPGGLAIVATIAVLTLTGCGDGPADGDPPDGADVDAFCKVIGDVDVDDFEQLADELARIGTPEDIPDDARSGFETLVDEGAADTLSPSERDQVEAFFDYVLATCGAFPVDDPTS